MDKLLTVNEVAEFLRVKPSTVYELVRRGRLQGIHVSRTVLRIRQSALDAFISAETTNQASGIERQKRDKVKLKPRPPLLSTVEVAKRLSVPKQTVLNWVLLGRLPATRVGRFYYVYEDDLAKFLEDNANTVQKEVEKGNGLKAEENDKLVFLSGEKLI